MTSAINPALPVAGNPTTASVRSNFAVAAAEITLLQSLMASAMLTARYSPSSRPEGDPTAGSYVDLLQEKLAQLEARIAALESPSPPTP
jgi:hypothetical protein